MKLAALFFILTPTISFAEVLDCQIALNLTPVLKQKVTLEGTEKVLIGSNSGISAYVTAKENNQFLVEAFLEDVEMRMYGEGKILQAGDSVSASLWSRNSLIDIKCQKN